MIEAALPVLLGSDGCLISGSIRVSTARKDLSATRSPTLNMTPLTTRAKSVAVTANPTTSETRRGATRCVVREIMRSVPLRSRPSRISAPATTAATSPTSTGCAVSTGGISIRARMEFCHSTASHK